MPKKRHPTKFTKPQSTPPPSLASSRARSANDDENHVRGVNELLADLRRVGVSGGGGGSSGSSGGGNSQGVGPSKSAPASSVVPSPSVPPALRQVLQLPEPPAPPPPRSRRVVDARGRRLPPGPLPPPSWLAQSRREPRQLTTRQLDGRSGTGPGNHLVPGVDFDLPPLIGVYNPDRGSLIDLCLAAIATQWDFQRQYNKYWLYALPDHLRVALIRYVAVLNPAGVSVADLRALLLPPPPPPPSLGGDGSGGDDRDAGEAAHNAHLNDGITCLDLAGSLGNSLELKELTDLLFARKPPPASSKAKATASASPVPYPAADDTDVLESWDAAEPSSPSVLPLSSSSIPPLLLPNLTRLSLASHPRLSHHMSWRQLLSLSTHLPTLTHLSLAHWPVPTLTPNAAAAGATIDSPHGRALQYGGTGFYSHSLDDDWSEAVSVLKRLSRCLYGLEYLDLTGCGSWAPALMRTEEHDAVDWVGAWGKVGTLVLSSGFPAPDPHNRARGQIAETSAFLDTIAVAGRIERHIVAQRKGRGRFIEVVRIGRLTELQMPA